ncbi:MAG: peptide chain release factor 3 [Armatimonadota bacterium]|nr:MAG: peptide chain release factor 3 [Armatimonadota bacterium]
MQTDMQDYPSQIRRRRTFAIISHPDAGKTTLTEKLLLYGGAIQMAGSVRARRSQRQATSDWMELERQRGISITSTVLQFEFEGYVLNLLDTPGHQDFSEDTFRTLMAADSAVMLIDKAKGVEEQTRKLFHVCRRRGIPIFTFINKLDRPGRDPLDLMAELEGALGIQSTAMNWPIGDGPDFRGIYDLASREVHLFERAEHGARRAGVKVTDLSDPALGELIGRSQHDRLREEIELLEAAGERLDRDRVSRGDLTPVYFGSALTNFGVELFLRSFIEMAPPPAPRMCDAGLVRPEDEEFRGFIFKVQANMDPRHRDRLAFLRIVSGKFERDMTVFHPRLGRTVRLTRPQRLFGQEREVAEEGYPGDIIGLTNPGVFTIGDTVCTGQPVRFREFPHFPPEHFAVLRNTRVDRYKQFLKGIQQLSEEGVIQLFYERDAARREPIVGVVGRLQFDVVRYRLETEYGVETALEDTPFRLARWLRVPPDDGHNILWTTGTKHVEDAEGNPAALFNGDWYLNYMQEKNPGLELLETSRELG